MRFSLKDLLWCMSLIALGLGTIVYALTLARPWMSLGAYGLALFGAGALTPFDRTWTGAGLGCLSYIVIVFVVLYGC
jgi:hypothetical protein